jgi:hypothetical protein
MRGYAWFSVSWLWFRLDFLLNFIALRELVDGWLESNGGCNSEDERFALFITLHAWVLLMLLTQCTL